MYSAAEFESSAMHDSSIDKMYRDGADVVIVFVNLLMDTDPEAEVFYRVHVRLQGVRAIRRDKNATEDLQKEASDSGVITFRREGHTATMLLEWCSYKPRRDVLALYEFDFDDFHISGELQGSYMD